MTKKYYILELEVLEVLHLSSRVIEDKISPCKQRRKETGYYQLEIIASRLKKSIKNITVT